MKDYWDKAVSLILVFEGEEYTERADDPPTKWGITIHTLRGYRGSATKEDLKALTRDAAIVIYKKLYWQACRCDSLPPGVDLIVFDSAVNHGVRNAGLFLQRALRDLDDKVKIDGAIGPKTLAAVKRVDGTERVALITATAVHRAVSYAKSSKDWAYLGWFRRLFSVENQATMYATQLH
jgi:lysozyme family protein